MGNLCVALCAIIAWYTSCVAFAIKITCNCRVVFAIKMIQMICNCRVGARHNLRGKAPERDDVDAVWAGVGVFSPS